MTTLSEALELSRNARVEIKYKCGSIHRGRVLPVNGSYYIAFNKRSLVMTRINVESVTYIRYTNSRVYLFRAIGRR